MISRKIAEDHRLLFTVAKRARIEERCTPPHQDEISTHTHLQGKELIGASGSLRPEGFEC